MSKVFFTNVRIIDGTGSPPIENGLLVYEDGSIVGHENNGTILYADMPDQALLKTADTADQVVDLTGHTVLPGLFNVHSHLDLTMPFNNLGPGVDVYGTPYRTLLAYRRAAEALVCGVTSLRHVAIADDIDIALRKAFNKGMLLGPNIVACGTGLIAHGGHGWQDTSTRMCSGTDEFMREARMQIARGADQIKLMYTGGMVSEGEGLCDKQMTDEEVAAVVWVAHAAGKKVCAHLSDDKAIYQSVLLGVDCVEHGYTLSEKTAKLMAEHGTYYVPTILVSSSDEYLLAHGNPPHVVEKGREAAKTHRAGVAHAYTAGVKICIGTDLLPSDPLDGTNATVREMEILGECGMAPLDVIKAATYNSAELCDLHEKTGHLKPGLLADLLVVEGNPSQDLKALRNLRWVAKGGRLVESQLSGRKTRPFSPVGPDTLEGGTFRKW